MEYHKMNRSPYSSQTGFKFKKQVQRNITDLLSSDKGKTTYSNNAISIMSESQAKPMVTYLKETAETWKNISKRP
jgi:hypothetical protein